VVVANEDQKIERFVEKPTTFVSDNINAGLYLFNEKVLERIPNKPCSIEREIFPQMASDGKIFQFKLKAFWMDIGQPRDYLIGQARYIKRQAELGKQCDNDSIVHDNATIESGAEVGPNVVIGENCYIESGVKLVNCAILSGTTVKKGTVI
jgi:mannose-1-phosphate guanylyltransferase